MRFRQFFAGSLASTLAIGAAVACSSSSDGNTTPTVTPGAEAGSDAQQQPTGDATFTEPTQTGRIIDAVGKTGVSGAMVTTSGRSVTTNEDGTYAIGIVKNVPTTMRVTAADHFGLIEQEWIIKTDLFARMDTSLLSTSTATFLASLLPARAPAKGLLAVRVYPLPPCVSEQGSTLTLKPAGTAKLTYFKGGLPDKTSNVVSKDESFSGIFTDVDPGVPLEVVVDSPICEQVPFPVDYGGVTLTGAQKAEAGDVVSYIRVFIGPKKVADSGTD
jgi:hypothetical protein